MRHAFTVGIVYSAAGIIRLVKGDWASHDLLAGAVGGGAAPARLRHGRAPAFKSRGKVLTAVQRPKRVANLYSVVGLISCQQGSYWHTFSVRLRCRKHVSSWRRRRSVTAP